MKIFFFEKIRFLRKTRRIYMKKKVLSAVLCASMVMAMTTGCGSSSSTTSSDSSSDSSASTTAETTASAETTATAETTAAESTSDGDVITIGFAQVGHESDWRTASTKSCQDVFSEENGYDLQFVDCDNDSATQLEAVRGFIEQDVDYIIIDPIVSTGWDTVLTECEDAGIPVIVIDRTIDDSDKYVSWVGSNFQTEGLAAGEWLKAYADEKGIDDVNVLVIEGSTGASATIGRTDGFKEIADKYGFNIIDSQSGDFTQAGGQEVMESYCKSYEGQFNVVICQNDNEAFGAMDAMKAAGVSYGVDGDVVLVSFDACTAGLEYVMSGDITADFECNPLAAPFVEQVIQQIQNGETPDKEVYMEEHWYVNEDILSSIDVDGETQNLTVVTQDIVDAQY
jgi:simple sugar transport system substrate-binding protein